MHSIVEREGLKWYRTELADGSTEFEPVEMGAVEVCVVRTKYGIYQVHTDTSYKCAHRDSEVRCYVDTRSSTEQQAFRKAAYMIRNGSMYASRKRKPRGLAVTGQPQLSHGLGSTSQRGA